MANDIGMSPPSTPTVVAITQARILSTRLPRKVLLPLGKKTLLEFQIDRLKRAKCLSSVAVATADTVECEPIASLCEEIGTTCVRGDENDVLSRFVKTAKATNADIVVRVTSDCPLIDPAIIDLGVETYLNGNWDFVALDVPHTFPRGVDLEVFSADLLFLADREGKEPHRREHVTPFMYDQKERFQCHWMPGSHPQGYRFCVDTAEDYELVQRIVNAFNGAEDFSLDAIAQLLDQNAEWTRINADIRQKPFHE